MLQICPRIPNRQFDELPFEDAILTFLRELGHSEHKDAKKSNEMYYPRFTKVIVNFFMTKDQSILRRNKTKASVKKKQSSSDTTMPPPTAKGKRLKTSAKMDKPAKEKQPAKTSKAKGIDEETSIIPGVPDVPTYESNDEEISWKSSKEDDDDGDEMDDEGENEKDDANELYRYVNINLEGQQQSSSVSSRFVSKILNPSPDTSIDSIFNLNTELTPRVDVSVTTTAELPLLSTTTLPPPHTPIIPTLQQTLVPSHVNVPCSSLQDLPNFGSLFGFDHQLKALEINFSEFMQINQFAEAISSIPGIVDKYLDHQMNEAVKVVVQLQSDRLRDEAQAKNEDFLNKLDENIQKIIKEQVKEQVKAQVSKNFLKIEKTINEQLKAEVLTRSSNSSKTSYAEKTSKTTGKSTEGSKSHHKSANESAPTEEPMHTTKDLEEPAHQEFDSGATDDQLVEKASQHPDWKDESRTSFNELMDTPLDFLAFVMNRLKVETLTLELLAGPTYELMKGSCKSLVELEFFLKEVYKETIDQLDWNNPEGQKYPHDLQKPLPLIPTSRGHHIIPFDHFINNNLEYLHCGVSSRMYTTSVTKTKAADYGIITVTELQIVEWHNYKHLDWITVRRDDDKLYKFKEGGFKRLRIQEIEDMLLLLVQGKLTNLTVDERLAFNVSLRMFIRSIIIQRRMEDLQLGVKSYQKKINLTKSDKMMRIDELHKFSDGTLNDVRTALDGRLKEIRMQYLPQTIWRRSDKDRAAAMIQATDKQLRPGGLCGA
nr:hypothetical protein [Tanacetum cinerariifolium]